MAHGIESSDKGYVGFCDEFGGTWHGLPQYVQLDGSVSPTQALEVLDFELDKRQNYGMDNDGAMREVEGSFHIARADTDDILVGTVGNKFEVFNNGELFRYVSEFVLAQYPQLQIESVGTLGNGRISFTNLMIDGFNVKGDDSKTVNRLMYYNPLGAGSYGVGAHSTRIVCNNTLQVAKATAQANGTMAKFSHTRGAQSKINQAMVDLSATFFELEEYKSDLEMLVDHDMSTSEVDAFLNTLFPANESSQRSVSASKNKQDKVRDLFEVTQLGMSKDIARSSYAMLNAVTYYYDHPEKLGKNADVGSNTWDGLVGARSTAKVRAFDNLKAQLV